MDYSDLLTFVHTKSEVYDFMTKLELAGSYLYDKNRDPKKVLSTVFPLDKKNAVENLCIQNSVSLDNPTAFADFIKDVKKYLDGLETVILTVAFEPNAAMLSKIADQLAGDLSRGVVIDLRVDKKIIGGAVIEFAGRRADYTVRKILNEKLNAKKDV